MDQSFFTLFAIQILSINSQHCVQTRGRNPSSSITLVLANFFSKLLKIEFQIAATLSLFQPSSLAPEVPRVQNHPSHEATTARIVPSPLLRFGKFAKFEFCFSCIINVVY